MLSALCPMLNAQCPMPNAQCSMLNAQCSMPNAQCPMLNAQCPMPNAQCAASVGSQGGTAKLRPFPVQPLVWSCAGQFLFVIVSLIVMVMVIRPIRPGLGAGLSA